MGAFVLGSHNDNFVSLNSRPSDKLFFPLYSTCLVLAENDSFLFDPLDNFNSHHRFSSSTRQYYETTSCLSSDEDILQSSLLIKSELHFGIHVNFNVVKLFAVVEIELLHNRNIVADKLSSCFEIISFDFEFYHCPFLVLDLPLALSLSLELSFSIIVFKRIFLNSLHHHSLISLSHILSKILYLFRNLIQVIVVNFADLYLFYLFQMFSYH